MIDEKEILRRRDMRDVFTFTIDPADAKDFDDAISFECLADEAGLTAQRSYSESGPTAQRSYSAAVYRIGIHIADVSYYVKPGTKTDDDAYQRGTSVYLVDRVIPMLPEELCNDKCSLRPGEDKLCMSVIFTFEVPLDAEGTPIYNNARVVKHKICRTVIRSDARLNYDEAQEIIASGQNAGSPNQTGVEKPIDFWLRKGKVDGESEPTETCSTMIEPCIGVNQTGETLTREKREGSNKGVKAELQQAISTLNAIALKLRAERIANGALTIEQDEMRFRLDEHHHPVEIYFEQPNEAHHLIEEFMLLANRTVAKEAGTGRPFVYRVHDLPDYDKLEEIKKFKRLNGKRVKGDAMQRVVDMLTIRAQAKAVYSTYNIGHYGLAFSHYTHFTSPIRRYPDLMVHRLVEKYILTGKKESLTREELELMCEHCSACEQDAAQAERDSVKQFQAMWMADHLGEILPGHIVSIMDFGFFLQLDDSHCEGLIRMELIEHPEDFVLGDPVMVQVIRVDLNRSQIDFELA